MRRNIFFREGAACLPEGFGPGISSLDQAAAATRGAALLESTLCWFTEGFGTTDLVAAGAFLDLRRVTRA